ncbi:MAG TPA: AEC family transporter, partial [Spirochaetota bacterium]|nr:AEC family transporter [Spirochaetota bacterium]
MKFAMTAINQISIMFLIMMIGAFCYRLNLIDRDMNKKLSNLVLLLVNPLIIFASYQREFKSSLLSGLLVSFILALAAHVIGILISLIVLRGRKNRDYLPLERFAVIYSNCGFIGIPLVNGVLGSEGVF